MPGLFMLLMSWLLGIFTRLFAFMAMHAIATRLMIGLIAVVVMPIVANNILYGVLETFLNWVRGYFSGAAPGSPGSLSFIGLAGYMMDQLGLISAFSIILNAAAAKYVLRLIPFIRA